MAQSSTWGCDGHSAIFNGYKNLGNNIYRIQFNICIDETNGKKPNKGWLLSITGGTILSTSPDTISNIQNGGNTSFTPVITGNEIQWGCLECMHDSTGNIFIPILGNKECFEITVDIQGIPSEWRLLGNYIGTEQGCIVDGPGSCDHPNCVSQSTSGGTCLCKACYDIVHGCIRNGYEYCCASGFFPDFVGVHPPASPAEYLLNAYPNPSKTGTFQLTAPTDNTIMNIVVRDVLGRLIPFTSKTIQPNTYEISINTDSNTGLYFIQATGENDFNASTRIVIQ
ncbi:MAG: T9SS type A sorting domain-containing protein [Flavobacteriales bacterium]|nr:T9SS type A sorting domain-containing protein [Flavobacteriales bacterium]MCB9447758.1 T9SS type A sorting domain-containing protein [Flavobacteriales bacterium]